LSTIAIPSENLTFITAGKKKVVFTFKDCNGFDESVLQEGESIPKANITVACKEGDEAGLIEDVINFMSRDTAKNIMKFDVVEGKSTFDKAVVDTVDDVRSVIPSAPVNTITKEISIGDEAKKFQQTIAEITFPGDLPFIDFNHEMLSSFSDTDTYTTQANSGTYATGITGTTIVNDFNTEKTLVKKSVPIGSGAFLKITPQVEVSASDYTLYVALNTNLGAGSSNYGLGGIYGDKSGELFGFGAIPKNDGAIAVGNTDIFKKRDVFCVRHSGITGAAAFSGTTSSSDGTKSFAVPGHDSESEDHDPNHVFIVRRDKDFNMFLHNRDGDIISKIPAKTLASDLSLRASSPGRTDGSFILNQIGQSGGQSLGAKAYLYRFGIIQNDIGANDAANLAKQLSKVYGTK